MTNPFLEQRAKQMIKDRALRFGYCPLVTAQLIRTFHQNKEQPLSIQVDRHVRRPEQSVMVA